MSGAALRKQGGCDDAPRPISLAGDIVLFLPYDDRRLPGYFADLDCHRHRPLSVCAAWLMYFFGDDRPRLPGSL